MSTQDPSNMWSLANYIGPYDFQEKNFVEPVTFLDYAVLSAVLATLPSALLGTLFVNSYRMLFEMKQIYWWDRMSEEVMSHLEQGLNWRQLRILCPVRPLREELAHQNFLNLNHYNYYFGGEDYSARWLVEKTDRGPNDPVILYMHGGSYALKVQAPQLYYLVELYKMLNDPDLSILILDYTIGDVAKHPAQLNEGMACYKALKETSDNIIFFGDSCGGHLALAMLLSGAECNSLVLVSPSVDMTSGEKDDISMREVFVNPKTHMYNDPLISPIYADPKIWTSILPRNTLVVWGENEPCKQQMIDWTKMAQVKNSFEEPDGSHDCILRGNGNPGSTYIKNHLQSWLNQ